jgi:pilus assembly protein CpaE
MSDRLLRAALISTDPAFQDQVRHLLADPESGVELVLEFPISFSSFDENQVQHLRTQAPDIAIVDLQDDPDLGIKFVQFLNDTSTFRVIAAGPTLEPQLLLAAMRAGIGDYLAKPVTHEALHEAIERLSAQLGRQTERARKPGKIYTFFSSKGGSGSTTVAANSAIVLHRLTGKRTLLIDLDLELGEVALVLGIQPRFNFVDLVQNFHRMDSGLLASYIEQHESGVHLLSAPFHPERAEMVSPEQIRSILQFLRQHYDYLVVDTPKSFSAMTFASIDQSDQIFVVANLDLPSLRNIQRGLPMLQRALPRGEEQIRLIVNRYKEGLDISLHDVEKTLGLKVYQTLANDFEAVIDSINRGRPLVLNGKSAYSQDIKALVAQITGLRPQDDREGRGVMGRVMGRFRAKPEGKKS